MEERAHRWGADKVGRRREMADLADEEGRQREDLRYDGDACDERTTSRLLRGSRRRTGRPPTAGDGTGRLRGSVHGEDGGATATARWETARW